MGHHARETGGGSVSAVAARWTADAVAANSPNKCLASHPKNGYASRVTMNLISDLKTYRAIHKFTQAEAALRIGVPIDTLQNWECGRNTPRGLALRALLQIIIQPVKKSRPARRENDKTQTGTPASTGGGTTTQTHND
jgi:DNA-binding transcriptional regulator YiaG